ncbi:acyl-CoA Delta-9 desaturase-like isoform X1 [Harmonia axyridis]|uniref:acyl-CoA Delta-9 desaturase-like isoform X1 n=1 Tax=Harmonia axyridis TaxID=115357 RepID=UPI001E275C70|nr:acyl-CoA Delta-9 desaturase-like isoform X1 [Harmonia axyridis]XP_045468629.1 acyl-CoA Delta-9 desaturase-like isoform X1 [Harmonia axyridis]XP_045468630.1 acyl-CoA Delta-9 desaturase-like isoform X1 [Harmonia axyridis]
MLANMVQNSRPSITEVIRKEVKIVEEVETKNKSWKNLWHYFGEADLKWFNIILLGSSHAFFLYTLYYIYFERGFFNFPWLFTLTLGLVSGLGVTAGAHRLFTHRCYKANLPLRSFLVIGYILAGMNSLSNWVRDHRVHHKFTDTVTDPHNATRGFFFSHVGWLMMKKHPSVIREGKKIDMSDLLEDPLVQFQEKYFLYLSVVICHIAPVLIPWYFWNYAFWDCFCMNMFRWVLTLNNVWSVNSAAHIWGSKPYDKSIKPTENRFVAVVAFGEGWHNYHHTFPWDYRASEYGRYLNLTGLILNMFAAIGWAYDLKTPSPELIQRVATKRGDGSWYAWGHEVPESADKFSH